MIADADDIVVHAGWDVPNYRWYELEGLRVGTPSSGNDLLIERECTQVSLAAAADRHAALARAKHHRRRGDPTGTPPAAPCPTRSRAAACPRCGPPSPASTENLHDLTRPPGHPAR